MSEQGAVSVNWSAIKRRIRENGGGLYLLVKATGVKGSPADLLHDVDVAREAANAAMVRDGDDTVWAGAVMPSGKGPVVDLDWVRSPEENQAWLETFSRTLAAAGRTGTMTAAPEAYLPEAAADFIQTMTPTAHLAFTAAVMDPYLYARDAWLVSGETTRRLAEHAANWVRQRDAVTYFSEQAFTMTVSTDDLADAFVQMAYRSGVGSVETLRADPYSLRQVAVSAGALVVYSAGAEGQGWRWTVPATVEVLRDFGRYVDVGFVRFRALGAPSLDLTGVRPDLPHVRASSVRSNPHVHSNYVTDAYAIQVLTKSHLEKANDLSAWDIEELGNDRFLVQAHDLEPWFDAPITPEGYGYPLPDKATLEAARRNLGAMILTEEVLKADPRAWFPGQPLRPVLQEKPTLRRGQ